MTVERRLPAVTMDALGRCIRPSLTPAARARFTAAGLDLENPRGAGYTEPEWELALTLAREGMYPDLPPSEGAFQLGRRYTNSFFETMTGKALHALVRLLGPSRTMARTADNLRSGNPFIEVTVTRIRSNEFEVSVSPAMPDLEFMQGLMEEGVRLAGAKNVRSRLLRREGRGGVFHYVWDE